MKKCIAFSLTLLLLLIACGDLRDQKTSVLIEDNDRHYHPILFGQELDIVYNLKNTGKAPLLISDIFTSCACLTIENGTTKTIPAGEQGFIRLKYKANMTVGYAKHYISLYGNFDEDEHQELIFDVNVVPDQVHIKDYEDVFREESQKNGGTKQLVDGNENNKGYYINSEEY